MIVCRTNWVGLLIVAGSFVVEAGHSMMIGGVECITLGHGVEVRVPLVVRQGTLSQIAHLTVTLSALVLYLSPFVILCCGLFIG